MSSKGLGSRCSVLLSRSCFSISSSLAMHRNSLLTSASVCNLGENELWSQKVLVGGKWQVNGLSQGVMPALIPTGKQKRLALALPKLPFSSVHLPSGSELIHLSQRAQVRAVKGCYQQQQSGKYFCEYKPVAHRVIPSARDLDGAGTTRVCWSPFPSLCPGSAWRGPKTGLIWGLPSP